MGLAEMGEIAGYIMEVLKAKGEGFNQIIKSCNGNSDAAAKMLLIEKLEQIVQLQTDAIKNIKIDKITVWDSAGSENGNSSTSNFVSSFVKSLPPLQDAWAAVHDRLSRASQRLD
jgi:flotillin